MASDALSRVRQVADLVAYLEAREPLSSPILQPVLSRGLDRRHNRAWWVGSEPGDPVGVVLLERARTLTWVGQLILEDESYGEAVGDFFQRNGARALSGTAASIDPVLNHLPRLARSSRVWFTQAPAEPLAEATVDDVPGIAIRAGSEADLAALTELFAEFELYGGVGLRRLHLMIKADLRADGFAVAVAGDRLVGAISTAARTRRYAVADSLTVLPEFRGQAIGAALTTWQARREGQAGRGMCAIRAASNGLRPLSHQDKWTRTEYVEAALAPRRRIRGGRRMRSLVLRVEGPPIRSRPAAVSKNSAVPGS